MRQTLLAALAGPLLIAAVAGGVLFKMQADANGSGAREGVASKVTYLTARSGDPVRSKALTCTFFEGPPYILERVEVDERRHDHGLTIGERPLGAHLERATIGRWQRIENRVPLRGWLRKRLPCGDAARRARVGDHVPRV